MADFLDDVKSPEPLPLSDHRGDAAAELARLAGKIALDYFERAEVSWKPDDSMVTDADVAVQTWLEDEIAAAFPSDGVLGEEGLTPRRRRPGARFVWILDPVDGTNNFGRGIPGFAVSVGVMRDGMPFAGAVYDPVAGQLFSACVGQGARLNGRRLRVAPAEPGPRTLFSIRSPFEGPLPPYVERWLGRYRLRRFGSTALQLCYVAAGALSFVHDHRASLWDVAAAAVIVAEAGGLMTAPDGAPLFPIDPHVYAGESIGFLGGDSIGHRVGLADIVGGSS
jgi:myo-inositol-1(or 4)-monophosphatase